MKTQYFIISLVLLAVAQISLAGNQQADFWEKDPVLKALKIGIHETMGDYSEWVDGRTKTEKGNETDVIINELTDNSFLALITALNRHPNAALLEECLLFLGTKVPDEFDEIWNFTLIEMNDIDEAISAKVTKALAEKGKKPLQDRFMRPPKKGNGEK